jgi:glycerophosphoryl diester phosphodiesterase
MQLVFAFAALEISSCALPAARRRVVVVAHRGAHAAAPENSLAAIRRAMEIGCDYVELDVRETRDGALVLMHDGKVDRMTDGTGEIAAMTLAEVRKLGFEARPEWGRDWSGEKVPTFDEALEECRGKMKVYVDNKTGPPEKVMAAIESHGMVKDVVIYGSVESLRACKRINPAVWIMPDHPRTAEEMAALLASLRPETLDGQMRDWTPAQVAAAKQGGAEVWVDNLGASDNEQGYRQSLDLGVDGIQTDHPEQVLELLGNAGLR